MNKPVRFIALLILLAVPLAESTGLRAAAPESALAGDCGIDYTLIGGGVWPHVYTIDRMNPATGEFSGTGRYVPDPAYAEIITGRFDGSTITFHVLYTGFNAGYTVDAIGKMDSNGQLFGTATSPGQMFTWTCSRSFARPDSATPRDPWWNKLKDSLQDAVRQFRRAEVLRDFRS